MAVQPAVDSGFLVDRSTPAANAARFNLPHLREIGCHMLSCLLSRLLKLLGQWITPAALAAHSNLPQLDEELHLISLEAVQASFLANANLLDLGVRRFLPMLYLLI